MPTICLAELPGEPFYTGGFKPSQQQPWCAGRLTKDEESAGREVEEEVGNFQVPIVQKRKLRHFSFSFYTTTNCQFILKSKTLLLQLMTPKNIRLREVK